MSSALDLISRVTATVEPISDSIRAAITRMARKVHGRVDWVVSDQIYYFKIYILHSKTLFLDGYCVKVSNSRLRLTCLSLDLMCGSAPRMILQARDPNSYLHAESSAPAIEHINKIGDAALELGAPNGFYAHLDSPSVLFDYMESLSRKYGLYQAIYKEQAAAIIEYCHEHNVTATVEPSGSTVPLFYHLYQELKRKVGSLLTLYYTQPKDHDNECLWVSAHMVDRLQLKPSVDYTSILKFICLPDGITKLTVSAWRGSARSGATTPVHVEFGYIPKDAPAVLQIIHDAVSEKYNKAVANRLVLGTKSLKSLIE